MMVLRSMANARNVRFDHAPGRRPRICVGDGEVKRRRRTKRTNTRKAKTVVFTLLSVIVIQSVLPQSAASTQIPSAEDTLEGVYRVYFVADLRIARLGERLGSIAVSGSRSADSPYFVVGFSNDGIMSIVESPYRYRFRDETSGHIIFWPAEAEHRYQYASRTWNIQPVVEENAFVVVEYESLLEFEGDAAYGGSVFYMKRIVPGGQMSDHWIEMTGRVLEIGRRLVKENPWE